MIWTEAVMTYSTHYSDICLEDLSRTTKHHGLDSRRPGRDSNQHLSNTSLECYHYSDLLAKINTHTTCQFLKSAKFIAVISTIFTIL
jgi:hypothetical protein